MNETIVKIAAAVQPIMKYLYDKGILSVNGYEKTVHVREKQFHETFPVYETEYMGNTAYHTYTFEGIKFFCIAKEDN